MTFVFDIMLCLVIVLLQTVIFPLLPIFNTVFDIFLPIVIYMAISRSFWESIFSIVILGMAMDSFSGAPFGLYLSCYIWLFVVVYWFKGLFHIHSFTLLSLMVLLSAIVENTLLLLVSGADIMEWYRLSVITREIFVQLFTAAIIGPLVIIWTTTLFEKISMALSKLSDEY